MLDICADCPLYSHYHSLSHNVQGSGDLHSNYALIGEAPGWEEVKGGAPFIGKSGDEQDAYLHHAGLSRGIFRIDNLLKCQIPKNDDPTPQMVECCGQFLTKYLETMRPKIIGAVGRYSARWLLNDPTLSVERYHGIPFQLERFGYAPIIVPIYHPASAMHGGTTLMTYIAQDYQALSDIIKDRIPTRSWPPEEFVPSKVYTVLDGLDFNTVDYIAVDTETLPEQDGAPWCLTWCTDPDSDSGNIIMADDTVSLHIFNALLNRDNVTTILHNAPFDIPVLSAMGVRPRVIHDTMSMAYLLQDLPIGLKSLSYRLCNIAMREYAEVIKSDTQFKALMFLFEALKHTWPDPDELLIWDKGQPRIKRPQNISKKIQRSLKEYSKNPDLDLYSRWKRIAPDEGRGMVESKLGPMHRASLADVDPTIAKNYACVDAIATRRIYPILAQRIKDSGLWDTFTRDMGIVPSVVEMRQTGVLIDTGHFSKLSTVLDVEMEKVSTEIDKAYNLDKKLNKHMWEKINPGSPKQVGEVLYNMRIFRSPNQSTAVEVMDKYRDRHKIIDMITRWRELSKLKGTYVDGLPSKITPADGRLRSDWSMTRTVTGRLASSKPNLMNIPTTNTPEGREIRDCFVAIPGCVLMSNDYSQIEMRIAAHMSQDKTMLRLFREGVDIHTWTASRMFNIPIDQVDKVKHRYPAKRVGFGVLYSMGAVGLRTQMRSEGVEYTEAECKDLIDAWFEVFTGIRDFMEEVRAEARRMGMVRDIFGRYRLIPEILSSQKWVINAGLRQACNAPIQMGAQGVIKEAMVRLHPRCVELRRRGKYIVRLLIQIHDDLMFEVSEEIMEPAIYVIRKTMENAVKLTLPTPVDTKTGYKWGSMEEYKP